MANPTQNTAALYLPSGVTSGSATVTTKVPRTDTTNLGVNGHWQFDDEMRKNPKAIGFVYGIRNKADGKMYIGKKLYVGMGVANKGIESNWKYYVSSNKVIDEQVRLLRAAGLRASIQFDFVCIEEYESKGGFSFAEVWSLAVAETPSNPNVFYNRMINGVSWNVKEKVTPRHKSRLINFINGVI